MIREINREDMESLLRLYLHLHETEVPPPSAQRDSVWEEILADPHIHIIAAEEDGQLVSSCTCIIIPNLTRSLRPYALVENVVTDAAYRGRGLARECLDYARELARAAGCYKIMLLTSSKEESTLRFYEKAGYSRDKTGFVQKL